MNQTALPSSLKWSSPKMERCRVRTSTERQSAIMQSWPITALPAGWRVTDRCRQGGRGGRRPRQESATPGPRGPKAQGPPARTRCVESRNHRRPPGGDDLKDFEAERKNQAKEIIEDFMIAAKRNYCALSRVQNVSVAAARGSHTQTLGPNHRACPGAGLHTAPGS
jgi:hypothetical protein